MRMKFNPRKVSKLTELILYVAEASECDPGFGAVKLNKILFYADFLSYFKHGKSITGEPYFALQDGPAPKRMKPVRAEMEDRGDIALKSVTMGMKNPQVRVIALRAPRFAEVGISAEDISITSHVIDLLKAKNGTELSKASHDFIGWQAAMSKGEKTVIQYATVCLDPVGFFKTIGIDFEMPPISKEIDDFVLERDRALTKRLAEAS